MIPIDQSRTSSKDGNCFQACLASILELPLDVVPTQRDHREHPFDAYLTGDLRGFLAPLGLGVTAITLVDGTKASALGEWNIPTGYWIAGIRGGGGTAFGHAVVMRGRDVAHDPYPKPNPFGRYLDDPVVETIFSLVPLDPARTLDVAA